MLKLSTYGTSALCIFDHLSTQFDDTPVLFRNILSYTNIYIKQQHLELFHLLIKNCMAKDPSTSFLCPLEEFGDREFDYE